jgi:hypothetical protein
LDALETARKRAAAAGVTVNWIQADVLNPPALRSFDLIFDRGCYHGVRSIDAASYLRTVKSLKLKNQLAVDEARCQL